MWDSLSIVLFGRDKLRVQLANNGWQGANNHNCRNKQAISNDAFLTKHNHRLSQKQSMITCRTGIRRSAALTHCVAISVALVVMSPLSVGDDRVDFFEKKIRPQMVEHCYQCHSAAAAAKGRLEGDLQLDTRDGTRRGGDTGPAVVPGNPEKSLLISALRHDELEMPPKRNLPARVIADFVHWIKLGAVDPRDGKRLEGNALIDWEQARKHWAFRPLDNHTPPDVAQPGWIRNGIDRFILAKLREKELTPANEADERILVRRAYFDLIGLPPSPKDVTQFVDDASPSAWEALIDRLLESDHYGERWGRHWLDVARFGESEGSSANNNNARPNAYKYRDAVIKAFNADMPFDEFVAAQLAGQAVSDSFDFADDLDQFPQLGSSLEDSDNPNDKMFHKLDDMVSATGSAFLGMTVGCARCHDHKIDPIPAEDYYRLTAVFFDLAQVKPLAGKRSVALEFTEPHLLAGGSWKRPVRKVSPGFVTVLMRDDRSSESWLTATGTTTESSSKPMNPRHGLARWLTDVDRGAGNLLARVIVNRLWQHHFGRGIVKTPNDFGHLGAKPSHPQLLDWLASELIRNEWHLKPMHRLIMNSATYRQASGERWLETDAENQWVWHYQTQRLEAEIIRDNMLSVSGALNPKMYGPSVPLNIEAMNSDEPEARRRSLYTESQRFTAHPTLRVFDSVDNFQSVGRRTVSTTPSSALFMLNAPFVWRQAGLMAERIRIEAGNEHVEQVNRIYEIAFARPPTADERILGIEFLETTSSDDDEGTKRAFVQYCHAIMGLNEFIYVR